jgi:drug/metabolite transporter (DMT)-like permease
MKSLMFAVFFLYGIIFSVTIFNMQKKIFFLQLKQTRPVLFLNTVIMFVGAFLLFLPAIWSLTYFLISILSAMLTQFSILLFFYFKKRLKQNSPS